MNKDSEESLQKIIRQIGDGVRRQAPPFEEVWRDTRNSMLRRRKMRLFGRLAVAASISVVMVSLFLITGRSSRTPATNDIELLSEWRSPTDILLESGSSFSLNGIDLLPTDVLLPLNEQDASDDREDS